MIPLGSLKDARLVYLVSIPISFVLTLVATVIIEIVVNLNTQPDSGSGVKTLCRYAAMFSTAWIVFLSANAFPAYKRFKDIGTGNGAAIKILALGLFPLLWVTVAHWMDYAAFAVEKNPEWFGQDGSVMMHFLWFIPFYVGMLIYTVVIMIYLLLKRGKTGSVKSNVLENVNA